MQFKPHPYQQHTINFIKTHPEAAILLSMGMGKTVSTLTAIHDLIYDTFQVRRALIIAPLHVAKHTWPEEIHKWDHLAGLTATTITGTPKQRLTALADGADIHIINRENIDWLTKTHAGKHWPYDMVVIDELSSFKSHTSNRFKALRRVRPKIRRIVGLTGTPAPNGLMDLFAEYRIIDGGKRLGTTISEYRNRYFTPGKRNGHIIYEWNLRDGAEGQIYDAVKDITVSMKTTGNLKLPECTYTTRTARLDAKTRATYDTLKRDFVADIGEGTIDAGSAAVLQQKLQQLTSGAVYTTDEVGNPDGGVAHVHDAKLELLDGVLEEAAGQPVLVAYWFKHELDRLQARYPEGVPLDGADTITKWNAGEIPLLFIHPASAGHGLNLQHGGHIMVWMTTPWSLELYEQANARLHRQGQKEPVSIIALEIADSIDQRVGEALSRKDVTQSALMDAVKADLQALGEKKKAA